MCNLKAEGGRCAYHEKDTSARENDLRRKNHKIKKAIVTAVEKLNDKAKLAEVKQMPPGQAKNWAYNNNIVQSDFAPAAQASETREYVKPEKLPASTNFVDVEKYGFFADDVDRQDPTVYTRYDAASNRWASKLSYGQQEALAIYTDEFYEHINKAFYAGKGYDDLKGAEHLGEPLDALAKHIDKALERVPFVTEPHLVYRGFSFPEGAGENYLTENFVPGATLDMPSFTSTTLVPSVVNDFIKGRGVMMEIVTKKGGPIGRMGEVVEEREHLLPRNMRLRVMGVKEVTVNGVKTKVVQLLDEDEIVDDAKKPWIEKDAA